MNEYQQQLLEHYHSPLNFGNPTFDFTHHAKLANTSCGDEVDLWLKINFEGKIEDLTFNGEGCSIAIGTASLLFNELKGKSVEAALSFSEDEVLKLVGIPLTMSRIKCATLPFEVLKKSLKDNPVK